MIVQHCFGAAGSGGPISALDRLLSHSVRRYGRIHQSSPANGINKELISNYVSSLRAQRPELLHIRGLGNEGFHAAIAAKIARVPNVLVSIHGTHRDLVHKSQWRGAVISGVLEPATLHMATHIATVCEAMAARPFLNRFRSKLVGVVPNGVELTDEAAWNYSKVREELGIPAKDRVVITVSRITLEKGYDVLAEALAQLDKRNDRFTLLIVGGGDEHSRIRSLFCGLKGIKVHFLGHRADVGKLLRAADFFVLASRHENMSNALLEAMGSGLPAIATAVGGNIEVVNRGGGLLVPVNSAGALSDAMHRLLSDPLLVQQLGTDAQRNVATHYSVGAMVRGWESVYDRILGVQNRNC